MPRRLAAAVASCLAAPSLPPPWGVALAVIAGSVLGGLVVAHRSRRRVQEFRSNAEAERQAAEMSRDDGLRRAAAAAAALERLQAVIDRQARSLLEDQEGVRERH